MLVLVVVVAVVFLVVCKVLHLEFLFIETVFEETEDWNLCTIDVTVFAESNHTIDIHWFAGKELQFFETAQNIFHIFVNVVLEYINLVWTIFFQFGNQSTIEEIKSIQLVNFSQQFETHYVKI